MYNYDRNKNFWDEIFLKELNNNRQFQMKRESGSKEIDDALDWLSGNVKSIIDFGCGNGNDLISAYLRGTTIHLGIDISKEAINCANRNTKDLNGEFNFKVGSIDTLLSIDDKSFDGAILFNIIDNLHPNDMEFVLKEIKRIVRDKGKIIIKLNPKITDEQIKEWNIKVIEGDFLDDGLYLYNKSTEEWSEILTKYFTIIKYNEVFYKMFNQKNRLFYIEN